MSIAYTEHLAAAGIRASIGTVGDNYDNALAEAVNGLYKAELIHARPAWPSMTEVEFGTLRWVHWWNTERLHENPDYQTSAEVEAACYETRARAAALVRKAELSPGRFRRFTRAIRDSDKPGAIRPLNWDAEYNLEGDAW